ncbi:MAG: transglycosylase SLT domain-containing protein [Bacteroidaceae bacterium]|jgi:membrane-bound lytic murein transglycosylase D|nr:transglycosylase SLT domain-containing protein [Bacteroidaceae bacterium]
MSLKTKILVLLFASSASCASLWAQQENVITVHDEAIGADEQIGLPEGMMLSVDSLMMQWNARQYLFPETTGTASAYLSNLSASDYADRLSRIPAVMELPHNNVVQEFIDRYTGKNRGTISFCLAAGNFYIPLFEEALEAYGLPLELKYLPVIESALNPVARSKAGAVGLWQFMLTTGKRYDLEVNSLIDERQDPLKSTWAAARYLKDLYDIYKDWNLVIAAYNCGPGNVNKAIHRAEGVTDYWKIYPYLPTETRGYVPAFIAANYAMYYYCQHQIEPLRTAFPVATDTVMIHKSLHFDQIAELCNIDKEAIRALNPQYKKDLIPGNVKPYALRLPQEKLLAFIDLGDSVYNHRSTDLFKRRATVEIDEKAVKAAAKNKPVYVTVRQGDNLGAIARRNHTTVAKIKRLNNLKNNNIRAGKRLRVK